MSSIRHREYQYFDRGVGLEPLLQEFVYDSPWLDPKEAQNRVNVITGYYKKAYQRHKKNVRKAYNDTRKFANRIYVQHHLKKNVRESSVDYPKETLSPDLWEERNGEYVLRDDAREKILSFLRSYPEMDLLTIASAIHLVGSTLTNQYKENSDIDIHIVPEMGDLPGDKVEFVSKVKKWSQENPQYIGKHPMEVYIQLNPDQDLLGDAVYEFDTDIWVKGPKIVDLDYDPYGAFKSVLDEMDEITKDSDLAFGELKRDVIDYKTIREAIQNLPNEYREVLLERLRAKLSEVESDIERLLKNKKEWVDARHNASKPTDSKQALEDLETSKKWQDTNAMFKFLNRYNYIRTISDLEKLVKDGELTSDELPDVEEILGEVYV